MHRTRRILAAALSGLGVALVLVVAPAVAADADTSPDFDSSWLQEGEQYMLDPTTSQHDTLVSVQTSTETPTGCDSQACHFVYLGFTGPVPASGSLIVSYLSTYGTSHLEVSRMPVGPISSDDCGSSGLNGCAAATFWGVLDPGEGDDGHFAGLVCAGVEQETVNGEYPYDPPDDGPCHLLGASYERATGHYGEPRAGKDLGHGAQGALGSGSTNPGQQADGHVDIAACFSDRMGSSSNPFEAAIMAPLYAVQCGFLWAITPPTSMMSELVNTQSTLWGSTMVGKTIDSMDFYSAFNGDNSCSGIPLSLSGLKPPGSPAGGTMNILSTCAGAKPDLNSIASLVKLGLTVAVLLGGALNLARMITKLVKGPALEEQPDWEDPRLF